MWSNMRKSNSVAKAGMRFNVRCRTTEIMLGTAPSDPDIHREFIASKAPTLEQQEMEVEAVQLAASMTGDEDRENWLTVYPVAQFFVREDGRIFDPKTTDVSQMAGEMKVIPFIHAYQIRGSFKESISMLTKASGGKRGRDTTKTSFAAADITAYKKAVDGGWFVTTPRIPLYIPETYINNVGMEVPSFQNGRLQYITRPLRCETAKGPRVCLASSEFVPAGTEFEFEVHLLNGNDFVSFVETMDLKGMVGMLQWRGGGKGTLDWTICNADGVPYEEFNWEDLDAATQAMIDEMNDFVDGICTPIGYAHTEKPKKSNSEDKPKRGRKKASDGDAADEASTSEEEKPKRGRKKAAESSEEKPKRGRRKKVNSDEEPVADAEQPTENGVNLAE